jgi:myo-inositol-1(or 4)-monophosphatase
MTENLAARAEFAGRLARAAGALANRYFHHELDFVVETKSQQDYVSAADRAVEAFIRAELARAYPDDAMLGEETGGDVAERTWVVDPIDGTLNFVHGVHFWCVSIAWLEEGQRRIGAVYDPCPDELFVAARGAGATCNGVPIHVSGCDSLDRALLSLGYVHRHDLEMHLALTREMSRAGAAIKDMGAGALMLAQVAAGRYEAFLEPHMHAWDAQAGLLLVEEAGGRVLPYPGPAGLLDGGAVIASNAALFDIISAFVAKGAAR